jgi:hypothetical protein
MHKLKYLTISIILVLSLSLASLSFNVSARPLAATSPNLGVAESYSVLGGQTVTNTGPTSMPGSLGVSPGSAVTGESSLVVGPPGTIHKADQNAADAQAGNTAAFTALNQGSNATCTTTYPGVKDLVGETLVPGVYCAVGFRLTGTLTLSGTGVWVFKSDEDLVTLGNAIVVGSDPCNVWWRVGSSATLGVNTSFIGNILALTSISLQTGASLTGRALAQNGQVSLDTNTINGCIAAPQATSTETSTATQPAATSTTTSTATQPGPTSTATATLTGTQPGATSTATATQPGATLTVTATKKSPTHTPLPAVTALPGTGGGPIRTEEFPWSLVIVAGFSAIALVLGIRTYRSTHRPK